MGGRATKGAGDDPAAVDPMFRSLLPYYLRDVSNKERPLGNGSYATVTELEVKGKKCAAKQLKAALFNNATPQKQDDMLQRFAAECKLLEGIEHPNIVRFYGVHLERGSRLPYLVMELLDSTLSAHLREHGVPDPPTYYNILSDVALGLRYLHEQSPPIVHRDLSANNVLLSSSLRAKISDLGVAKVLNFSPSEMTHMTKAPGTPVYMPPEACVDSPHYTTTIDTFSFGVLMIHTLCGDWPSPTPATRVDPQNPNQLIAVSEFDRCASDINKIGLNHPLIPLIRECLHNSTESRPAMSTIVRTIVNIQISQPHTTCATYLVHSCSTAKVAYELSLTIGEEVIVVKQLEGEWMKAKSLLTQDVGYVPSHLLCDKHQLALFVGLEDCTNAGEGNLCFKKGDLMYIINTEGEEIWFALHKDTGQSGYLRRVYIRKKIERMRCYFGVMSHAVADDLLKQPSNDCGSYLVHDESGDVRCLALRGQDCIKHYKVESSDGFVYLTSLRFKTLKDLINHYMTSPLESIQVPLLGEPCNNEFGPLQPHVLHDVVVKCTISESPLSVSKEVWIKEREKCAGKQYTAGLFSLNTAEETHEMLLRFADQCRLLKSVQHSRIVEFLGVYFEKGSQVPYMVTEFLDSNLSTYLEEHGVPPPPTYYSIFSDVASGLRYLHEQSPPIIHGDLSARNVLLSSDHQAKISSFGVIHMLDHVPVQNLKSDPESLCYTAPEAHLEGSKCSTAIDCFSFGILMIHTLCAKCPISDCHQPLDASSPESKSPLDQCDVYIKTIYYKHPLLNMIYTCLDEKPRSRPDMTTIEKTISEMKETQFPLFAAKCDHDSCTSGELSFKKGDLMYVIGMEEEGQWFAQLKETGKQGYIANTNVEKWHNLDDEVWFFGSINILNAEKQLLQPYNQSGSFLVRKSESKHNSFTITVRKGTGLRNYRIQYNENGEVFVLTRICFPSIPDLVNYYSKNADGLCTSLMYPCQVVEQSPVVDLSKQVEREWEIDRSEIKLVHKLGEGTCKEMWKGTWNGVTPVAVKILKPFQTMSQDAFLQEANVMKKLHHANVIQLYGVCTQEKPAYIITELMKNGNLAEYLRKDGCLLKLCHLLVMCAEVACGMAYLEEQNIIHKHLAAHNILVAGDITCKVTNIGMVQVADASKPHRGKCIKWMAPEAALHNQFTTKSDVWSFGIVVYEIVTHGHLPYPEMSDAQVLEAVQQGYRMPQPNGCPDNLYNLMQYCWKADPEQRYTFEALQSLLFE